MSNEGDLKERAKTEQIGLLEEVTEEVLQGKVARVIVITLGPQGDLNIHTRVGYLSDTAGALNLAHGLILRKALHG